MTSEPPFEQSVFLNCPFDADYAPILQAVAFCVTDLGFRPRLAPENADGATSRLDRIVDLIRGSKYGIHDLSRSKLRPGEEFARLNMPFELGIDHASSRFGGGSLSQKTILVLEQMQYDYQKALSDISGWDIEAHGGDHVRAVKKVRGWLVNHAGAQSVGATRILQDYQDFQEWHWERELDRGASEDDIREYPTIDFVRAMQEWFELGKPV